MKRVIRVSLIARKREGTTFAKEEEKVNVQLELPDYMSRFILNDIKGDLRIALSNKGYGEEYKYSGLSPKITITIE